MNQGFVGRDKFLIRLPAQLPQTSGQHDTSISDASNLHFRKQSSGWLYLYRNGGPGSVLTQASPHASDCDHRAFAIPRFSSRVRPCDGLPTQAGAVPKSVSGGSTSYCSGYVKGGSASGVECRVLAQPCYLDEAAIRSCLLIAVLLWACLSSTCLSVSFFLALQAWNRLSPCGYYSCEGCGGRCRASSFTAPFAFCPLLSQGLVPSTCCF